MNLNDDVQIGNQRNLYRWVVENRKIRKNLEPIEITYNSILHSMLLERFELG